MVHTFGGMNAFKNINNFLDELSYNIESNTTSNKLLENIKLSVKVKTGDGVDVDKTFGNFELNDDKESIATFTVPNEPRSISIRLDCEVKNMSKNAKQSLSKSTPL